VKGDAVESCRVGQERDVREVLPANPGSVTRARELVAECLGASEVGDAQTADALLVVSELVTNAIRHGSEEGDEIVLECSVLGRLLRVAVSDPARRPSVPVQLTPSASREGGVGLAVVSAVSESWTDQFVDGRRLVTAHIPL
jgi:anti-sigma regulatory factor (Ser/Thr protein kinase)